MAGTRQLLVRAGVSPEEIPSEGDRAAVIAAALKWMVTTEDGMKFFSRLFCFKARRGDDDKEYTVIDNVEMKAISVKNTDVWLFEGAFVRGRPVPLIDVQEEDPPPYELEVTNKLLDDCEGCGMHGHCLKDVDDPITEKKTRLCNYCMTYHEHPKVNDLGGTRTCERCTVVGCKHHPERKIGRVAYA